MFTTGGSKIYTNRIVMNSNSVLFQIDYFIRSSPYKKVKGSGNIGLSDNSVRSYKSLSRNKNREFAQTRESSTLG